MTQQAPDYETYMAMEGGIDPDLEEALTLRDPVLIPTPSP